MKEKEESMIGWENFSVEELKNMVVRLWKEIKGLEAEKKDYMDAYNASIKDIKSRIDSAVQWVGTKETEKEYKKIEKVADELLKGGK
jgi:hypothetical protein